MSSLTLRVCDLASKQWLAESFNVTYRNTLLGHLYPTTEFAIGDVLPFVQVENLDGAAEALNEGFYGYKLVGASGSRKHGRCIFAKSGRADHFTRFFGGSNMHSINYGSNLTTECKRIFETAVLIKVVEDGEYFTGDCHGKASSNFINYALTGLSDNPTSTPFQFRACDPDALWIAKGTLAYSPELDGSPYALVLPVSAFKGQKVNGYVVAPGEYQVSRLLFGIVHLAEQRLVNMSYSVTQFLPWSAIEADILPGTIDQAKELNSLTSNPRQLAEYLLRSDSAAVEDNDSEDDDSESDDLEQYIPAIAQLLAADEGQNNILSHPWVADKVVQLVRKRWLRLATAGAVRFHSYMCQPDESLPFGTVCVPDLIRSEGQGDLIGFPYPCRWKHDLNIIQNVAADGWMDMTGIIVGSTTTMLDLFSRDFDGDFLQVLPAHKLPNVAAAIRSFGKPQIDQSGIKPSKRELTGSLGEIAVLSMTNDTGLITWLIAKSWALGRADYVEMLVPQLQAAVDSLKGAAPPDQKLLDAISSKLSTDVPWLMQYKKPAMYLSETISSPGSDSISLLIQAVNPYWIELKLRKSSLRSFQGLFPAPEPAWVERANLRYREFSNTLKAAKSESEKKRIFNQCPRLLERCNDEQKMLAATAFWHSAHSGNGNSVSFVFLTCLPQICKQLATRQIQSFMISATNASHYPDRVWTNEQIAIRVVCAENLVSPTGIKLFGHALLDRSENIIGFISVDSWCPSIGDELVLELRTRINTNGKRGSIVATLVGEPSF